MFITSNLQYLLDKPPKVFTFEWPFFDERLRVKRIRLVTKLSRRLDTFLEWLHATWIYKRHESVNSTNKWTVWISKQKNELENSIMGHMCRRNKVSGNINQYASKW